MSIIREYVVVCDICGQKHEGQDENYQKARGNALNDGWSIRKEDGEII